MVLPLIYCDMDQVIVNLLGGARKALGKEFNDPVFFMTDTQKWQYLTKVYPNFWLDLDWMPEARVLWQRIKNYDTCILSTPLKLEEHPTCAAEKKDWCERELGLDRERVFVVPRSQKRDYAMWDGQPNVLIDDNPRNVREWMEAGGIGILHETVPETLAALTVLGL